MTIWDVEDIAKPAGSYSHAVTVPRDHALLFVAGQVGIAPDGTTPGEAAAQTEIAFENIRRILLKAGMTVRDIVKISYFVCREQDLASIRAVIKRNLPEPFPAASLVIVKALGRPEWLIEIECVASAADPGKGDAQ